MPEVQIKIEEALKAAQEAKRRCNPSGLGPRRYALVITKLEEALLWAKAADQMGLLPE